MLPFRSHCRNALKRNPFGEARLLYKLLIECTDDELREAVKSGIVEANDELQIRDHIRGLMSNFKTKIIGLITTGNVQPTDIDNTKTKEEFARSFIDNDEVLNDPNQKTNSPNKASKNAQMKEDYEKRLFDNGIVTTVLAKDVEDNRSAIAEALTQRKKTLLKDAKTFMENTAPPFRRRRAGISKFFDSLKGKPTDQAIIERNRKEFEDLANASIYEQRNKLRGADVLRTIDENLAKIKKYRDAMTPILTRIGNPRTQELIDLKKGLNSLQTLLDARIINLDNTLRGRAKIIDTWQAGAQDPVNFKTEILATVDPLEQSDVGAEFDSQIQQAGVAHPGNYTTWNPSTKIEVAAEIQKNDQVAVAINEELESIQKNMKDVMDEIESFQTERLCNGVVDFFKKMDKEKEGGSEQSMLQSLKEFYASLNIEWTTPMEIYLGWKKYWEVRKQTRDEKERRGAARNAQKFGNMVKAISPFGDFETDVEQTLKAAVDNDDNGVKDGYIKLLKSGPTTFDGLFGAGGEYEKNQHDPLRTKGVLEYAAENGWLYDIDYDMQTVMGVKLVDGKNLPIGEDVEQYLETLSTANGTGSDKARNAGKSSIAYTTSWDPIVKRFKKELKLNNFWGAVGVMEKAIDKGKDAATCTKLAVLLIRELRNNEKARKYITEDMLDQIGNIAFNNVTWGYWALKETEADGKKKKIKSWIDDGGGDNIEMVGGIGAAIKAAEQDIVTLQQAAGETALSNDKIDELVGKLLAGQIVKEKGWSKSLSIFDSKYIGYRDRLKGGDPGKVAGLEDYKEDSEAILLQGQGLKKILLLTSQGRFTNDSFAIPFLADIVTKHEQLLHPANNIDPNIIQTYEQHWQNAFEEYMLNEPRLQNADQTLWTFTPRVVKPDGSIDYNGSKKPLWQTLYAHKLIKRETLVAKNNAFAKAIDPSITTSPSN